MNTAEEEMVVGALVATADSQLGQLIRSALGEVGIAVKLISSVEHFPEMNHMMFSLFIVDGDLQPGDAMEIPRILRAEEATADAAIVVLSHTDDLEGYDAGADVVLPKPLSPKLFMARVRSIMRRYNIIF